MFCKFTDIRLRMNEAGKSRTPFLFGIDFDGKEGFFIENPLQQDAVLFDFCGVSNAPKQNSAILPFTFVVHPETKETYQRRFNVVHKGLQRGDSFLTNLTVRTPIETDLSFQQIFAYSSAPYRLCIPDRFVCFSPECFVKIIDGRIVSFPMKGTIDASIPNAEQTILEDAKEKAEHHTIVDLIRNDLNRVAERVSVSRFRYIDEIHTNTHTLLQVSSEIEGFLPDNFAEGLGDLFSELLPAGSISGAPKQATLRLIHEAEQQSRGFYTGVAGYFDGNDLNSCVLIRFIEKEGDALFFRSGGGITINSNCSSEYLEVIQKVYVPFKPS